MRKNTPNLGIILALVLLAPKLAFGQDDKLPRAWQVQWENDTLAETDENYTNGLRISFIRDPENISEKAENIARAWCAKVCPKLVYRPAQGWVIGQNFYTPEDIEQVAQVPGERPWAGWLYAGRLLQLTEFADEGKPRRQYQFELDIGVVGPPALAEPVQKAVHEYITESAEPLGWDNQIDFVPTLNANFLYRRILKTNKRFDITPHIGGNFGNVQIYANAGLSFRLGRNISGFPISPIGTTNTQTGERAKTEWYFFAGGDARAVAYNIFLDGSGVDSYSVDSNSFVTDIRSGFSYRRDNWRFTYTRIRRSEEFPPPPNQVDGIHDFASISLSFEPKFLE